MAQRSKTSIKTSLDKILSNYLRARLKPFGRENAVWRVFEELAAQLETYVSTRLTLKVKWSVGKGNWTRVPSIAFLDSRETTSTQNGLYPVYLFREDVSGVYLALNQGISVLKERHGTPESRRILRERSQQFLSDAPNLQALKDIGFSFDNRVDLYMSRGLEKDYESSIIGYKLYRRGEIPKDAELLDDLEQLLRAYDQCLELDISRETEIVTSAVSPRPPQTDFQIASAIHETIAYIANRGFVYEPWQIAQYITALRTKPFVILAGITGTGKSKLPALVAEATGGKSKLVPVRPDWTDSAEVLGYTNLDGNFRPGQVLEIAYDAAVNADQFYTCIVDEMNLARVEHYFAEVLSRIEDRRPQKNGGYRTEPLLTQTLKETDAEWAEVTLSENLAIVGTVNMDETTHSFSRKVLDRAFTIELSEPDLANWKPMGDRAHPRHEVSTWPIQSWYPLKIQLCELPDPAEEQLREIDRAVAALQAVNVHLGTAQLQVGYRTRDEVAFYVLHARQILNAFIDSEGNAVDPLDLALHMKILPRITGNSSAIRRCVSGLLGWATTGVAIEAEGDVNSIIEAWEDVNRPSSFPNGKYPRFAARLCLMWQRIENNDSTSYWL